MENHWNGLSRLSSCTIFPDPRELLTAGSRGYTLRILGAAAQSLGYSRPIKYVVDFNDLPKTLGRLLCGEIKGILRRDYSDTDAYAYTQNTPNAPDNLRTAIMTGFDAYRHIDSFPKPQWFFQYKPTTTHLGKLMGFIVNGRLVYVISTERLRKAGFTPEPQQDMLTQPLTLLQ